MSKENTENQEMTDVLLKEVVRKPSLDFDGSRYRQIETYDDARHVQKLEGDGWRTLSNDEIAETLQTASILNFWD
jgi:uncharacterized protein YggL (DUF469 family)